MLSLSKHQSIRQSGPATGDMHRTSAGEVKGWKVEEPSIGVPSPACDGAVHDSGPQEGEDERWNNTAAFEGTTDDDLHGAGTEEKLVEAEDDFRNDGGTRRRGSHDILHAEVVQVTDESTGSTRVGERVSPEHPLEGCTRRQVSLFARLRDEREMEDLHSSHHQRLE